MKKKKIENPTKHELFLPKPLTLTLFWWRLLCLVALKGLIVVYYKSFSFLDKYEKGKPLHVTNDVKTCRFLAYKFGLYHIKVWRKLLNPFLPSPHNNIKTPHTDLYRLDVRNVKSAPVAGRKLTFRNIKSSWKGWPSFGNMQSWNQGRTVMNLNLKCKSLVAQFPLAWILEDHMHGDLQCEGSRTILIK